jgi:hypothetical protein
MSAADRASSLRPLRGFTAIEVAVVLGIVAATTVVVERTVAAIHGVERTMRSVRNTTQRCHQTAYRLRDMVTSSRKLFGSGALGDAYLAALALGSRPAAPGSRLPAFDEVGPLGPDAPGDPRVGNVLLLVREADPVPCVADPATKKVRRIDTYRLVCVYLSPTARTLVTGGAPANDLVEWRSWAFPSYGQVASIAPASERASVVSDLVDVYGFDELWDPNAPVDAAFWDIAAGGSIAGSAGPPKAGRIEEDPLVSKGGRLVYANVAVARSDVASRPRRPAFAVEPIAAWAPDGFEVKVCGTSGARKVWVRLTVEQEAYRGQVPALDVSVVANARDL